MVRFNFSLQVNKITWNPIQLQTLQNVIWISYSIQYDSAQTTYENNPVCENQNKIIQQVKNRHLNTWLQNYLFFPWGSYIIMWRKKHLSFTCGFFLLCIDPKFLQKLNAMLHSYNDNHYCDCCFGALSLYFWTYGSCRFQPHVHNLQMNYNNFTMMRGYQNDKQRNYYQPTSHIVLMLYHMLIWNDMCTCVSLVHHSVNSYMSENCGLPLL